MTEHKYGTMELSGNIIPLPEGVDNTTTEGIKASMNILEAKHFIFPFLAHAIGTFVGAVVCGIIAANHKMKLALSIGVLFLIGGIMMVSMVGGPMWFILLDLVVAYIPMAYIGFKISGEVAKILVIANAPFIMACAVSNFFFFSNAAFCNL